MTVKECPVTTFWVVNEEREIARFTDYPDLYRPLPDWEVHVVEQAWMSSG